MTEQLTLPAQVSRYGMLRFLAPLIVVADIIAALIVCFALQKQNIEPAFIAYLPPALLAVGGFLMPIILAFTLKPSDIRISRLSVDVSPIAIFGFGGGPAQSHSMGEFDHLRVKKIQAKNGFVYRVVFCGKDGRKDIIVDQPPKTTAQAFAEQLGVALNMKVETDA
jgi:hypothetical protein